MGFGKPRCKQSQQIVNDFIPLLHLGSISHSNICHEPHLAIISCSTVLFNINIYEMEDQYVWTADDEQVSHLFTSKRESLIR